MRVRSFCTASTKCVGTIILHHNHAKQKKKMQFKMWPTTNICNVNIINIITITIKKRNRKKKKEIFDGSTDVSATRKAAQE